MAVESRQPAEDAWRDIREQANRVGRDNEAADEARRVTLKTRENPYYSRTPYPEGAGVPGGMPVRRQRRGEAGGMKAETKIKGGYVLVKTLGEGPEARVQVDLRGDGDPDPGPGDSRILEIDRIAGHALRDDTSLRAKTCGNRLRIYRDTPLGEQTIADLTPMDALGISMSIQREEPPDIERILMVYREPVSGIPKTAIDLRLNLTDTGDGYWAGVQADLQAVESADTRDDLIEKLIRTCREKLSELRREGRLEKWAVGNHVRLAHLDPPTGETGFREVMWSFA